MLLVRSAWPPRRVTRSERSHVRSGFLREGQDREYRRSGALDATFGASEDVLRYQRRCGSLSIPARRSAALASEAARGRRLVAGAGRRVVTMHPLTGALGPHRAVPGPIGRRAVVSETP